MSGSVAPVPARRSRRRFLATLLGATAATAGCGTLFGTSRSDPGAGDISDAAFLAYMQAVSFAIERLQNGVRPSGIEMSKGEFVPSVPPEDPRFDIIQRLANRYRLLFRRRAEAGGYSGTQLDLDLAEADLRDAYLALVELGDVDVIENFTPPGPGGSWANAWWDFSSP